MSLCCLMWEFHDSLITIHSCKHLCSFWKQIVSCWHWNNRLAGAGSKSMLAKFTFVNPLLSGTCISVLLLFRKFVRMCTSLMFLLKCSFVILWYQNIISDVISLWNTPFHILHSIFAHANRARSRSEIYSHRTLGAWQWSLYNKIDKT